MRQNNLQLWTVTRQRYWIDGRSVVEIAEGGIDYTNPDALCAKYDGEFCTYTDPREAVETAISILRSWRADGERKAMLAIGSTGGCTMPFENCSMADARTWAKQTYAELPRCPECGDLMGNERWSPCDFHVDDDEQCCSERCCEKRFAVCDEEA